ncbi:DeoR/GlpR family DNA-binding transcription regulator [Spiroplasma chrysopicola]|uniref:Lactose phosphotransferase system repressor n=1 Tax=Spiroplasma chrysopicola DF-1 TaxID=1276227 RepID=R4UIR0_9MOLU|nr:DeoR/GlpR family DNA-binding transcription regulator [Spiroplasma chrysopicola]AGM25191.1 DeoR family transcriptional regulator [Spiroplasma chrysopicola DF-1]
MHRFARKKLFLSYLCTKNFHNMQDILEYAKKNGISSTTTRRDLKQIEQEGIIELFYGGVNFIGLKNQIKDKEELVTNFDKKIIIAQKAETYLQQNDFIFVGSGSTCELFVSRISRPVKVITNSYRILNLLEQNPNINYIILVGGKWNKNRASFYGSFCEESLGLINFTKVFFSASHVDHKGNIYKTNEEEARVELAALAKVQTKIALIDSTKIGKQGFYQFYHLDNLTSLITDNPDSIKKKTLAKINII